MARDFQSNAAPAITVAEAPIPLHPQHRPAASLLSRLGDLATLSAGEIRVIEELGALPRHASARAELLPHGVAQAPRLLMSGWACYHRVLGDGRRQIVSFVLPGDSIGSLVNPDMPASCAVVALTPVVTVDARPLISAAEDTAAMPGLAQVVRALTNLEEWRLRDQVVRLGRQTAYERMVHLILEFRSRLGSAGLTVGNSFTMPLTQETLADALGLSVVHVNRTLQQIRRDGLLELRGGQVTLLQPERMEATADWRRPPR